MTNKAFKNYHKNKIYFDVTKDNYKMLCIVMLTLNSLFPKTFYPKKIQEWLEEYEKSCKEMNDYEDDGVYDYKMEQLSKEYQIDTSKCIQIVHRHLNKYNYQNTIVLADNMKLALIHTACNFNLGTKRLNMLVERLLEVDMPNAIEKIQQLGINVEWDFSKFDIDKIKPKKNKVSFAEAQKAKRDLQALKAYQEKIGIVKR